MYAENSVVYKCSKWQKGEDFYDFVPDIVISIFPDNLIVEAICSSECGSLVVASKENERGGLQTFEGE